MSLLELVVALAISGTAISTAVAGAALVVRSRQVAANAADTAMQAGQVRDLLSDMLSGAVADEISLRFLAYNGVDRLNESDRITFVTRHVPARTTAFAHADVYLDRDPATSGRGLVLVYSSAGESVKHISLAPNATAFNVRYRSDDVWQAQWNHSDRLPRALELTLAGDSLPRLLRIPIVVLMHNTLQ